MPPSKSKSRGGNKAAIRRGAQIQQNAAGGDGRGTASSLRSEVPPPDSKDGGDQDAAVVNSNSQLLSKQSDLSPSHYRADYLFELFLLVFVISHMLIQSFNIHMTNLDGYNTSYIAFTAILFTERTTWKFVYTAWQNNDNITLGIVFRVAISVVPSLYLVKSTHRLMVLHDIQTLLYLVYPYCLFFSLFGQKTSEVLKRYNLEKQSGHGPVGIVLNFRQHIKHLVYSSLEAGYYATILPIILLQDQNTVYDRRSGTLISVYAVLNAAVLMSTHLVSSRWHEFYLQARTLGCWSEVKRSGGVPHWHQQSWAQGATVRYNKKTYIAQGQSNTAEPDSWSAWILYRAFRNPRQIATNIVFLEVGIIASQIAFLLIVRKWQAVTGWAALILLSYMVLCYTLFVRHKVLNQTPS